MGLEGAEGEASAAGTVGCMRLWGAAALHRPQGTKGPPDLSTLAQPRGTVRSCLLPPWAHDIPQNCPGTRCLDGACPLERWVWWFQ